MSDSLGIVILIHLVTTAYFCLLLTLVYVWLTRHPADHPDNTTENWLSHLSENTESNKSSETFVPPASDYVIKIQSWSMQETSKEKLNTASSPRVEVTSGPSLTRKHTLLRDYACHDDQFIRRSECFPEINIRDGRCVRCRDPSRVNDVCSYCVLYGRWW
ncbi:hypothetical protein Btru_028875 [Bulinus truncatus]|nr:hypothetical protein Btru_028875 [Bulinus truncatus]